MKKDLKKSFNCLSFYWTFGFAFGLGFWTAMKLMNIIYG